MLDVDKIGYNQFSKTHSIHAELQNEPPQSHRKKTFPYPHGQLVYDINILLKNRCFIPYNLIVYVLKAKQVY